MLLVFQGHLVIERAALNSLSTYPIADAPNILSAPIAGNGWEDVDGERLWSSTIVFVHILSL